MKTKKIIKIISQSFSILGLASIIYSCVTYGPFVKAAGSVQKLTDHFYYMEFSGDYHLEENCGKSLDGRDNSVLTVRFHSATSGAF